MNTYTWAEISKHNNRNDCWLVIDDYVYDVTEWIDHHPGGEALAILAGEDASAMAHSCHLRDISPHLERLRIGQLDIANSEFISTDDEFLRTLKKRVADYLTNNNIDPNNTKNNMRLCLLSASLLLFCWACMYALPPWGIFAAIPMGLATCSLIGSFGHERIHGNLEISNQNKGLFYHLANNIFWGITIPFMPEKYFQYEHLKHHNHPMDPGHDYDVYALSYFVRLSPQSRHLWHHNLQHLYAPFVYGMYIFLQVINGYITPFFDRRELLKDEGNIANIVMTKLIAVIFHFAIPIYLTDIWWTIMCASIYFFSWQTAIYVTSGLPHMTDVCPDSKNTTWPYYVCCTTKNLKCGNPFFDWLTGGLNYHLAHHLLPSIPRDTLPLLSNIVKQTCDEFKYPYFTYESFLAYYIDHLRFLKKMGTAPNPAILTIGQKNNTTPVVLGESD